MSATVFRPAEGRKQAAVVAGTCVVRHVPCSPPNAYDGGVLELSVHGVAATEPSECTEAVGTMPGDPGSRVHSSAATGRADCSEGVGAVDGLSGAPVGDDRCQLHVMLERSTSSANAPTEWNRRGRRGRDWSMQLVPAGPNGDASARLAHDFVEHRVERDVVPAARAPRENDARVPGRCWAR